MNKWAGAALLLIAAALFLIANRSAYRGYFQDDELNNIRWTRELPASDYLKGVLTPRFFTNNFRPVGHYYFRQMSLSYGLDFPKYLPILHLTHILNIWLLWMLARRLGLGPVAASLGTFFFAFHMALFDVFWKPMYVFDLFCATFTLASILFYSQRRYILSLCAFWLAYKSKELAVMLPVALACYEFLIAEKKNWKPLIPFFALSLLFGLQGVLLNPNTDNDYTFRFTFEAFWTSLRFYASRVFFVPYAGLALLALPLLVRDRRLWFGCAMMCLFFVPLLFLPGRLYSAYCYLPFAGSALMVAALASRTALTPVVAVLCLLWIPWNLIQLRRNARETLAIAAEKKAYISTLRQFAQVSRDSRVFVYDGVPTAVQPLGISEALQLLFGVAPELYAFEDKKAATALQRPDAALLIWNPVDKKLVISRRMKIPYATMDAHIPLGTLGAGWYSQEPGFRWAAPHASATLTRPAGAREFELVANVSGDQLKLTGPIGVAVTLNGVDIGKQRLTAEGHQTARWTAPDSGPGQVSVDIDVTPEYRPTNGDIRRLGIAVVGFGFR